MWAVKGVTTMSTSGGESYTHLLIPTLKTYRPTGQAVAQFMESVIQSGFIGKDYELRVSQVVRIEPRVQERRNPFSGELLKVQGKSRKAQPPRRLQSTGEIGSLPESEYDASLASSLIPHVAPFALGNRSMAGAWQPFNDDYHSGFQSMTRIARRVTTMDSLNIQTCRRL